jgi:ABC-type transport system substrate-binding protein
MRQYCERRGIKEPEQTALLMGRSMERLVDRAMEQKDYARGRHVMHVLEQDYPNHPTLRDLRNRFIQGSDALPGAERLRQRALAEEAAGRLREASFLIMQAADMWPTLPDIDEQFTRIFRKYPVLHVAVREMPARFAPWAPAGTPDARIAQLLHVPLMEVAGVGANTRFTSRLLEAAPELGELQKRVTLTLTPGLKWSDGDKPITAMDISRSITARTDPKLPSFDPALASVLKAHNVTVFNEIVVDLKRIQLRPQTNFLFNLAPGHRLLGDRFAENTIVGAGPYRYHTKKNTVDAQEVNLVANQHFFGGKPKITEIVERRYAKGQDAVKSLLSGDVALLEHVPLREYRRIESRADDFTIVRGAVPAVHVISFDFRSRRELMNSRTLRRAMVYALDRKRIFDEGIMDGQTREGCEIINGPFPRGSFAFEPSLESWPYEVDAERVKKGDPIFRFTLHHPDTEEAREACRGIKAQWALVNIAVDLVPRPTQALEEDIALGSRYELVYRIHYVRDPVLDAARVLCLGQPISAEGAMPNAASAWLRQNLGDLELAANWTVAINKLKLIQHQARDDVALIPLWQLNDYHAFHKRLSGVLDSSLGMYQDAETWQIEPWYRKDPF